jgi:hypothetical protein
LAQLWRDLSRVGERPAATSWPARDAERHDRAEPLDVDLDALAAIAEAQSACLRALSAEEGGWLTLPYVRSRSH